MSLDIWLTETIPTEVCSLNITHNITNMWEKAKVYDALYMSSGKRAMDILPYLADGLKDMEEKPEEYKILNASNGWGTYEHALSFLKEFYNKCKEYPEAIIGISK